MIDYAEIAVSSGKGGDGLIHFMRIKYNAFAGPDGGDGAKGGDVHIIGTSTVKTLAHFRRKKFFNAQEGQKGQQNFKHGKNAPNIELKVPIGTIVTEYGTDKFIADISSEGQKVLLLEGGKGGRGNASFKSSTNQAPENNTLGAPGKSVKIKLELKLLSDIGFIGLPSVGKSSLLNYMTGSRSKTAEYHFTTLEPSIGILKISDSRSLIMADLPGLIEGASEGKGLGEDFLRHIERCGLLVHVLDPSQTSGFSDSADISEIADNLISNYQDIRLELQKWDKDILNKKELVLINKSDVLFEKDLNYLLNRFKDFFGKKYVKSSDNLFILENSSKGINTPIGIALSSTYSGEGISELVEFFNTYYERIIQDSHAQASKDSIHSNVLEIDIKNLPNKRIFFKYNKAKK